MAATDGPDPGVTPVSDVPEGVRIERIFIVEVRYTAQAAERRPAHRLEHLTRVAALMREGRIIESGGCLDCSSAVLLMRVADEAEALRLIEDDVYTREGVWHTPTVRPYGRVVLQADDH